MIKLEDLKVGDYIKSLYNNTILIVDRINKKSFTTTRRCMTIYESEFKQYFVITEEEARASIIHSYNEELKRLNKNLVDTIENVNNYSFDNPYYSVDTEKIERDIIDLLEKIREELEDEKED